MSVFSSKILDRVDSIVIQAVRENCETSLVPLTRPIVKQFFPSETSKDQKDSKQILKTDEKKCDTKDDTSRDSIRVESQPIKVNTEQPQSDGRASQEEAVTVSPETNVGTVECQHTAEGKEGMNYREVDSDDPEDSQLDKQESLSSVEEDISPKASDSNQEADTQFEQHDELVVESDDAMDVDDIRESVQMLPDDMLDDNMESSDVPVCESESHVSCLNRPMKRRSSKNFMLEQSQDTISSRTRSKDSSPLKSTKFLPPKKRARKL